MEKTTQQTEVKLFTITGNLDDHEGYTGQPVSIFHQDEDFYFTVQDAEGNKWYCGEEELTEITTTTPTKEVSTQGVWSFNGYIDKASIFNCGENSRHYAAMIDTNGNDFIKPALVLGETKEQVKERTERIVTAVNNHDALVSALQDAMEDLKNLACNYAGYSTNEDKPAYIGKLASYAKAKDLLTRIKQ